MSATANENAVKAVSNQDGQFNSRVPPSEPLEKGGHKPGVLASEADRAPEFHAETLPAGTAPASHTYQPNNAAEVPAQATGATPSASDTLGGATTADVHTGLGHPGQGQTAAELRHDGEHHRKKQGQGLAGLAEVGNKGQVASDYIPTAGSQQPSAEERLPESAERVAAEAPRDR